ncbi:MAG TPA: serine/threonine-protein kinase [Gemmataceae bacterium]|nr:serine/threonine-protein kinase [Gemmataceae bacterium]
MTADKPPPPTVDEFLKTVLRSGLMDRRRLDAAVAAAPAGQRETAQALADYLVRSGRLSRYQAKKLLQGTFVGLVMGPYQVLAPIGKGGMGQVYLARDHRAGQLIALKVLSPRKAEGRMLARFRREMDISFKVDHANVALTYEAGEYNGAHYIAMEYIPGKNLYKLVQADGPVRTARAARLFAEVASGLHHAHERGLVHRDLKPSNIMVTPHDHAKVLDLGLAIMQGEEIRDPAIVGGQGYIVGSMDYIAPEQTTDAAKVDRRADVYGLGCCLYFAVSGKPPFPGGTNVDKIHCHRTQEPVPLLHLNSSLPPAFVQIVRKMMAKDPARRYRTAQAVEEDLRAWAAGETVQPLDNPDDADFLEAVAVLQAADPPTDVTFTNLGIVDWKEATARDETAPDSAQRRQKRPMRWLVGLLAGVGALLFLEIVAVIIMALTARHK